MNTSHLYFSASTGVRPIKVPFSGGWPRNVLWQTWSVKEGCPQPIYCLMLCTKFAMGVSQGDIFVCVWVPLLFLPGYSNNASCATLGNEAEHHLRFSQQVKIPPKQTPPPTTGQNPPLKTPWRKQNTTQHTQAKPSPSPPPPHTQTNTRKTTTQHTPPPHAPNPPKGHSSIGYNIQTLKLYNTVLCSVPPSYADYTILNKDCDSVLCLGSRAAMHQTPW